MRDTAVRASPTVSVLASCAVVPHRAWSLSLTSQVNFKANSATKDRGSGALGWSPKASPDFEKIRLQGAEVAHNGLPIPIAGSDGANVQGRGRHGTCQGLAASQHGTVR